MKENLGYVLFIILGVLGVISLMIRCDAIDNSVSQENNVVEFFA